MKIRIKTIPLAFAQQGAKLGASVQDNEGRVLLTEGAELSEKSLASLRRRNISCVSILEEDTRSEEELAAERSKTTEHINAMFHGVAPGTNLGALHQLILEYRLEALL